MKLPKLSQYFYLINGAILFVGLLVFLYFHFYLPYSEFQKVGQNFQKYEWAPTPTTPLPPTPAIDTSTWKLYSNTKFKYQIMYPSNWYSRTVDPTGIISSYEELSNIVPKVRAKIEISIFDNPQKLSARTWILDKIKHADEVNYSVETKPITIDGLQAYTLKDNSLNSENTVIYQIYIQKKDKMYYFWVGGDKTLESGLFQILSTFKFTN